MRLHQDHHSQALAFARELKQKTEAAELEIWEIRNQVEQVEQDCWKWQTEAANLKN